MPAGWLAGCACWLAGRLAGLLAAGWLAGWMAGLLAYWLLAAGWLAKKNRATEHQQYDSCYRIPTIRFAPQPTSNKIRDTNIGRLMPLIGELTQLFGELMAVNRLINAMDEWRYD